jgi:hypothetical protein
MKETVTMDGGKNRISMTSNKGIMYSGVDFTILLTENKFNSASDFLFLIEKVVVWFDLLEW